MSQENDEGKKEDRKAFAYIILGLVVLLFLLTHFRIIKSGRSHLFIFTLSNTSAWTLHPKTISVTGGDLYLPMFTPIWHGYGDLESVSLQKPLRDDLYFYGTNLRGKILSIDLIPGGITGIFVGKEGQALVMDGRRLLFMSYSKEYKYEYKLKYGDEGYGVYEDDDEYEVVITEYFILLDFDQITLKDGTTITINDIGPQCVLKISASEWELYTNYPSSSFVMKNDRLKEDILVWDITFEPHFGSVIEYRLTEPIKRFGE